MTGKYLFFAGLCVAGVAVRTAYEILKRKGRIDTRSVGAIIGLIAAMSAFLFSWIFMGLFDPLRRSASSPATWTGFGLLIAGLGLAVAGFAHLKQVENIDHLVTTGLFSKLRHPMYTGFLFRILGWVLFYGSLTSIPIALVGMCNIIYWRWLEDRALESRYGEAFRRYRERTWF